MFFISFSQITLIDQYGDALNVTSSMNKFLYEEGEIVSLYIKYEFNFKPQNIDRIIIPMMTTYNKRYIMILKNLANVSLTKLYGENYYILAFYADNFELIRYPTLQK